VILLVRLQEGFLAGQKYECTIYQDLSAYSERIVSCAIDGLVGRRWTLLHMQKQGQNTVRPDNKATTKLN